MIVVTLAACAVGFALFQIPTVGDVLGVGGFLVTYGVGIARLVRNR